MKQKLRIFMSSKHLICALPIIFLLVFPCGAAIAAKGEVVYHATGCDYFLVETKMGLTVLEWFGGNDPARGDLLAGDFESYGMHDAYNLTADSDLTVWVEDYWLSVDQALETLSQNCE